MRTTSIAVYQRLKSEGLLSSARMAVYEELYQHGPLTGSELNSRLRSKSAHKRISELVDRGLVKEVRVRPCSITNESVIEWDVTDSMPREVPSQPSTTPTKAAFRAAVATMRRAYTSPCADSIGFDADTIEVLKWLAKKAGE